MQTAARLVKTVVTVSSMVVPECVSMAAITGGAMADRRLIGRAILEVATANPCLS
ncbi:hypothetical protein D3C87_2015700 [compost metagenome]